MPWVLDTPPAATKRRVRTPHGIGTTELPLHGRAQVPQRARRSRPDPPQPLVERVRLGELHVAPQHRGPGPLRQPGQRLPQPSAAGPGRDVQRLELRADHRDGRTEPDVAPEGRSSIVEHPHPGLGPPRAGGEGPGLLAEVEEHPVVLVPAALDERHHGRGVGVLDRPDHGQPGLAHRDVLDALLDVDLTDGCVAEAVVEAGRVDLGVQLDPDQPEAAGLDLQLAEDDRAQPSTAADAATAMRPTRPHARSPPGSTSRPVADPSGVTLCQATASSSSCSTSGRTPCSSTKTAVRTGCSRDRSSPGATITGRSPRAARPR